MMDPAEARQAVFHGADAVGLVGAMPSGPGIISDDRIAEIARCVPPPVATVLLTSEQSVAAIVAHHARVRTSVIQIVDTVVAGTLADLRLRLPGIKLMKVIHVQDSNSLDEAAIAARDVDALLLDSGRLDGPVKELGGTGRVHDWELSRRIRESVSIPIFLAGGLRPENVRAAIDAVGPFGVDVCSGVRTNGLLDVKKLSAFCNTVRALSGSD